MSTLKKLVNIYPTMPITDFNPPMRVPTKRVYKTIGEIRTCLIRRAIVDEIMPDGSTVRLGLDNYNAVLNPIAKEEETEVVTSKPEVDETPVVDETIVEEDVDPAKEAWQEAYNAALADVDLTAMSNKQRKAAKASARAAADEAVAKLAETDETPVVDETVAEEVEVKVDSEVVETVDAEDLTGVIE